ncbi:4'-phosphopantetheinyl transferase [Corynebacterium mendelii]
MAAHDLFPQSAKLRWILRHGDNESLEHLPGLFDEEKTLVESSVIVRKSQFADARWCAHRALEELGIGAGKPITRGKRGMPVFPPAVTGSITHSGGFRAAVVAPRRFVASIGIDAEPAEELPYPLVYSIARDNEQRQIARLRCQGLGYADRLLFCAKEATYKAWFPLTFRWLDFDQAEIDIRTDGTFISYLLVRPTPVPFIAGRWTVSNGFVIAATSVPAADMLKS